MNKADAAVNCARECVAVLEYSSCFKNGLWTIESINLMESIYKVLFGKKYGDQRALGVFTDIVSTIEINTETHTYGEIQKLKYFVSLLFSHTSKQPYSSAKAHKIKTAYTRICQLSQEIKKHG